MAEGRRVALVTGGTRGIGLGIARRLAAEGLDLAICGLREDSEVEDTAAELRSAGIRALYVRADIGERADRLKLIDSVRSAYGRLDVLVNNAGVAPHARADILDATEESFDRLIRINLRGPYFLTQAAARWMIEQRRESSGSHSCIINITSVSAAMASTNRGDYCLTKAALSMSTRLWAARLAEFGISVYEIRPGIVETDMTAPVKSRYDAMIADGLVVQGRWGTPDDVGSAAAMLARGDLPYSTGAVILVDGGMTIDRL